MTANYSIIILCLAGCDLGPRVPDPAMPDAFQAGFTDLLPAGTNVPSLGTNPELLVQVRINDGLVDTVLMMNNGVVTRGTGKSAGATVRYWNFGPAPVDSGFPVVAQVYVIGREEGGVFTPIAEHPRMIDTIPGDVRYSAVRRVVNVPVTTKYKGELITTVAALGEAIELGLVGDPVADGTWVNLPVVLPGTTLEVGDPLVTPPVAPTEVFGVGYRVDVFELGTRLGRQPFRTGFMPIGQASGLQTGVPTGVPPSLPTSIDPQPVFQYAIPTAPPGTTFSYSPLSTDVTVRLATNVAPAVIVSDADLFKRSAIGAITAFYTDTVSTFTIQTTVNNLQLQFEEGFP
ncbi:MAG TPA: hypothetical protein VIU61_01085 [Kofleriaceae bacterium]